MKGTRYEVELITPEVTLIRAALLHRAEILPRLVADVYRRLAAQLQAIGTHALLPFELLCIWLALASLAQTARETGNTGLCNQTERMLEDWTACWSFLLPIKHPRAETVIFTPWSRLKTVLAAAWPPWREAGLHHKPIQGGW